ncbi:hypothetical protein RvY_11204 [Ramazzottius varieornatus]|uniref:Uncharacterized protein n=1 Tax=Ramazzottius varieornatus TaxID=947166 RepID=A0A1D1VKS2_RAMVA|nr:hypothetical protein RvY_11204 [Ramazzottius varieornatus]
MATGQRYEDGGFVAIVRDENGTNSHVFESVKDINGLETMEHKYGSTFRAVTCGSDGAHIKAR